MPFKCPRCTAVFDTRYATAQHLWKKPDESHDDIQTLDDAVSESATADEVTPELLRDELDDERSESEHVSKPNVPPTLDELDERNPNSSTQTDVPQLVETDGGNPVFAHPPLPDGGKRQPSPRDEPECPSCGGVDYFDASQVGFDYGCPHCSTPDTWEVWNA
jgi:hypothetical protein